jgi:hypothetical protein
VSVLARSVAAPAERDQARNFRALARALCPALRDGRMSEAIAPEAVRSASTSARIAGRRAASARQIA